MNRCPSIIQTANSPSPPRRPELSIHCPIPANKSERYTLAIWKPVHEPPRHDIDNLHSCSLDKRTKLPNLAQVLALLHAAFPALDLSHSPSKTHQAFNVDISLLLKSKDFDEDELSSTTPRSVARSITSIPSSTASTVGTSTVPAPSKTTLSVKRQASSTDLPQQSPAKKQSKWSPDEDTKIIHLRGEGMKWEDISKHLPGRSAISCRLHYQNYLERRSEWDEDRKNKLARLYERFKADMWSRIAEEMAIPWRAAEAMHWQMGENEMARRAGVSPFTLANSNSHAPPPPPPTRTLARHSSDMTPHMRRNSGPPGSIPQLPSLAELTAGIPALAHSPYTSQPVNNHTEYPFPGRQSLPPRPMYDQHPQPNGRRYP